MEFILGPSISCVDSIWPRAADRTREQCSNFTFPETKSRCSPISQVARESADAVRQTKEGGEVVEDGEVQ
jgi:hypothetical protein